MDSPKTAKRWSHEKTNKKFLTRKEEHHGNKWKVCDRNRRELREGGSPEQATLLVDFWAEWCAPCRVIGPVVEELAADFEGIAKVAKLDNDANPEIAARFGVRSIPTLRFFKDGQVVDRAIGVAPKEELAVKLNALLQKINVAA